MTTKYEGIFEDWEIAIAKKIVRDHQYKWPCLQQEDEEYLLSGCLTHWYSRRKTYLEDREASIKSYMGRLIKNYLMSYLRKELAEKRKTNYFPDSLDQPINEEDPEYTLLDRVSEKESPPDPALILDIKASLEKLTPRQREICQLLSHKATKTDVSDYLSISRDTVYEEMKRIKEIFRKDELEDYPR